MPDGQAVRVEVGVVEGGQTEARGGLFELRDYLRKERSTGGGDGRRIHLKENKSTRTTTKITTCNLSDHPFIYSFDLAIYPEL